jgi:hypothetical protein
VNTPGAYQDPNGRAAPAGQPAQPVDDLVRGGTSPAEQRRQRDVVGPSQDRHVGAVAAGFGDTASVVSGGLACVTGALVLAGLLPAFRRQRAEEPQPALTQV